MIAYTGTTWTQIIVGASIFVPVAIAIAVTIVFLRGAKDDPDLERMRQAQREYEATRGR